MDKTKISVPLSSIYTELGENEKECVRKALQRLIAGTARKTCLEKGYGKEYHIDDDDLKKFFEEDLRIEPAEDSPRIHHEIYVDNASSNSFSVPAIEERQKTSATCTKLMQQKPAIEGGNQEKRGKGGLHLVPAFSQYHYKCYRQEEHKILLAKADKEFQFCVYFGHPVARGAIGVGGVGGVGGVAAGAGVGALVGSVVPGIGNLIGAGVGAAIGVVAGVTVGATAGAGIGAAWQEKVYLSAKQVISEYGERGDWYEEGKSIVYKVKYYYKHTEDQYELSDYFYDTK